MIYEDEMSDDPSELCAACESFDVRSLLVAAEQQEARSARHSDSLVRPGLKQFFAQHRNLANLKACASAGSCELCRAIWRSHYFASKTNDHDQSDEDLNRGLGGEQVFLGTEDRNISQQDLAHVVALQHSHESSGVFRRLACFEVCVQQG